MHTLWSIPELVLAILERMEKCDQAVMARVNRNFWLVTVAVIWESLPFCYRNNHLKAFTTPTVESSVPSAEDAEQAKSLTPEEKEELSRTLRERFNLHRPLIKSLELELENDDVLMPFFHTFPDPVLPNLQSLSITTGGARLETLEDFLSTILNPSLRKVSLRFPRRYAGGGLYVAAANKVKNLTGGLDMLSFMFTSDWVEDGAQQAIARAITANPGLKELTVADSGDGGYQATFDAASQLSKLEKLSFFSEYVRDSDPRLSAIQGFPSLRTFDGDITVRSIPNLLQSFEQSPLQKITLYCNPGLEGEEGIGGSFSKLAHFDILLFDLVIASNAACGIWDNILSPLTSSRNLETLVVHVPAVAAELDDVMIRRIAQTWPLLQTIEFRDANYVAEPKSSVTLIGLQSLAEYCHKLTKLKLSVGVTKFPDNLQIEKVGSSVKSLDLLQSRIEDGVSEVSIADFICQMWPNHTEGTRKISTPGSGSEKWGRVWELVNQKLEVDGESSSTL